MHAPFHAKLLEINVACFTLKKQLDVINSISLLQVATLNNLLFRAEERFFYFLQQVADREGVLHTDNII